MRRRYRKDLAGVDVAVVGMPFDLATTNRPGARLGPRAMRAASASLAWAPPYAWGFDPFERLTVVDHGDLLVDHGHPGDVPAAITAAYAHIVAEGVVPLTLGGDHYVSYPILRALHGKHGPLALVHFDAHSDTWREEGERIDHGSMFFHAARHGYVDPARSIQLGMRTHNPETHGYEVRDARWLHRHGVEAAIERIRARVGDGEVLRQLRHRFPRSFGRARHRHAGGGRLLHPCRARTRARPGRARHRGHGRGGGRRRRTTMPR